MYRSILVPIDISEADLTRHVVLIWSLIIQKQLSLHSG